MTLLKQLQQQQPLNQNEMTEFIDLLIATDYDLEDKVALLQNFTAKPLTQQELTFISRSLIQSMYTEQPVYPGSMCVCGTGGDRSNSFNISTTVSFVVASAGVPVIKHGNKSVTSASGSTDLLQAMQVATSSIEETPQYLKDTGLVFLSATETYPIMKHIQPVRKMLDVPTIFNITGPLINPFKLDYQVMGVYEPEQLDKIAHTLADLGRKRAIVLHGANGMDEATLSGDNLLYEIRDGKIYNYTINAEDVGLTPAKNTELVGGTAQDNLEITLNILTNKDQSAKKDVVLLNAGIALYVAEKVSSIKEGVETARNLIATGAALEQYKQTGGYLYDYSR
ncbi:anthranilate phosphoribosyltransferase [Staphylococcus sp. GDY8P100P]|uniref:anthranilate phosphoribosyltransferase n=1 Tax=Staphylococcus sp. GDY8P100P TaxID=2804429 RepID=UPI0019502AE9|nr:anthranilate phosphoribosyltransferase [Staphylococcus sp. GDY8P100P]